ncbi:response regulator [Leifsonia shinshuensis]|uniref:response regulator n=1 Tax=Leifsonia shinshuensis TaxID=150026 RepID=UPI002863C6BC|nr:response regulator [Leifsonia shinshuensis]MDR6972150.1 DNA-binding response OmpR family regulator [Leifsonia shinshuensis]
MDTDRAEPTILVVDDDPLIRFTVEAALGAHGYRVTGWADPRTALDGADPDAVLLDAIIPGCSLSECLDLLGRRADGSARPILVMSGSLTRPVELAATGIGYLTKPFTLPALLEAVEGLVASTSGTVT